MSQPMHENNFMVKLHGHPPTLNNIRRPFRNRLVSTGPYKKWLRDAVSAINFQVKDSWIISGKIPYEIRIDLYGLDRRSDVSNRVKAVEDALVKSEVVPDDRWCDSVSARRMTLKGEKLTIIKVAEV